MTTQWLISGFVAATLALAAYQHSPSSTVAPNDQLPPPASTPRTTEECLVRSRSDFGGVTVLAPGGVRLLVLDLVWGATHDLRLYPAYVEFVGPDGSKFILDELELAAVIFEDPSCIRDVYMNVGSESSHESVWVEELQMGISDDGSLVRLGMKGLTLSGLPIDVLAASGDPVAQCACQYMLDCYAVSQCNECKPITQGCKCKNPITGPRCNQGSICVCPSDGFCASGTSCTVSGPGTCGCL